MNHHLFVVLILLLIFLRPTEGRRTRPRPCFCPYQKRYVCGYMTATKSTVTFQNKCQFRCSQRANGKNLKFLYFGKCTDFDCSHCNVDTKNQWVCGINKYGNEKTYLNECLLHCNKARFKHHGKCTKKFSCFCSLKRNPVCSARLNKKSKVLFKTVRNHCLSNCNNYASVYFGRCDYNTAFQKVVEAKYACLSKCERSVKKVCMQFSNGTSYTLLNRCHFNCFNGTGVKLVNEGPCKITRKSTAPIGAKNTTVVTATHSGTATTTNTTNNSNQTVPNTFLQYLSQIKFIPYVVNLIKSIFVKPTNNNTTTPIKNNSTTPTNGTAKKLTDEHFYEYYYDYYYEYYYENIRSKKEKSKPKGSLVIKPRVPKGSSYASFYPKNRVVRMDNIERKEEDKLHKRPHLPLVEKDYFYEEEEEKPHLDTSFHITPQVPKPVKPVFPTKTPPEDVPVVVKDVHVKSGKQEIPEYEYELIDVFENFYAYEYDYKYDYDFDYKYYNDYQYYDYFYYEKEKEKEKEKPQPPEDLGDVNKCKCQLPEFTITPIRTYQRKCVKYRQAGMVEVKKEMLDYQPPKSYCYTNDKGMKVCVNHEKCLLVKEKPVTKKCIKYRTFSHISKLKKNDKMNKVCVTCDFEHIPKYYTNRCLKQQFECLSKFKSRKQQKKCMGQKAQSVECAVLGQFSNENAAVNKKCADVDAAVDLMRTGDYCEHFLNAQKDKKYLKLYQERLASEVTPECDLFENKQMFARYLNSLCRKNKVSCEKTNSLMALIL